MPTVSSSTSKRRKVTQPVEEKSTVVVESQDFQTATKEQEEKKDDKNQPFITAENVTFSLNQVVQMRTDTLTRRKIHKFFGHHHSKKLKGAVGRVIGIHEEGSSIQHSVQFDDPNIGEWLPKSLVFPSDWIEPFQTVNPALDEELLDLASKALALFFKAVDEGDLRVVKLLLVNYGVLDADDSHDLDGRTALHIASLKGHYELVEWLLNEAKVDIEKPDFRGFRAVHFAVIGCKVRVLELLMERGANFDCQNDLEETALHIAVQQQFTECLKLLMKYDADVNLQDLEGNTPIHIAIINGSDSCLNEMMPCYSINLKLRNKKGFNIIHLAVIKNNLEFMETIIEERNISNALIELLPGSRSNLLHYVCAQKNFKMAKLLIDGSKDWIMSDNKIPLLSKLFEMRNEFGLTAFLLACWKRDYAMIELLAEAGADVKALDRSGNTAIILLSSSPLKAETLIDHLSPRIFSIYKTAVESLHNKMKKMMETNPILSLFAYLMIKGVSLDQANDAGLKVTDKTTKIVIDMLNLLATDGLSYQFNLIEDGTKNGHLMDQMKNVYSRFGTRKDGSVHYRCLYYSGKDWRCKAVAKRSSNEDGSWTIRLESAHDHRDIASDIVLQKKIMKVNDENMEPEGQNHQSVALQKNKRKVNDENEMPEGQQGNRKKRSDGFGCEK